MTCRRVCLCQDIIEIGTPLRHVGPTPKVPHAGTGVQPDVEGGKTKTVKPLAIGASNLDTEELIRSILQAPYLLVVGDEHCGRETNFSPFCWRFWNVGDWAPWWGMLRVCSVKDKTAKTQAELSYDTVVNVRDYPRGRVVYVLSGETASVSAKDEG